MENTKEAEKETFVGTVPEFCHHLQYGGKGSSWNLVYDLLCRTKDSEYYYFMAALRGKKLLLKKPKSMGMDMANGVYEFKELNTFEALNLMDDATIGFEVESYLKKNKLLKVVKTGDDTFETKPFFVFYEAMPKKHTSKTDEEMRVLLDQYITRGYNVDPRMLICYRCDLVHPSMSIAADKYMPFNDHQIMYTNPGTGKSQLAKRTSQLTTRMSAAWMKGFSGAQKADTHVGGLSGMVDTITFDEFQSDDKFVKSLPAIYTLMDSGKDQTLTGHGTPPVDTRFKLRLCGNPGDESGNADYELLMMFNDFLEKSTDNYQAMGRRFALILFSNDFEKVYKTTLSEKGFEKAFYEWSAAYVEIPEKFDELLNDQDVVNFLAKPHDKSFTDAVAKYRNLMESTLQMQVFKKPIRAFISELPLNYRRIRGMALKLAVYYYINSFLEGKASTSKILERAELEYTSLVRLQVQSLDNMFRVKIDESDMMDYYKSKYALLNGIEQALIKAIVLSTSDDDFHAIKEYKLNQYYLKDGNVAIASLGIEEAEKQEDLKVKLTWFGIEAKVMAGTFMVKCAKPVRETLLKIKMIFGEPTQNEGAK
jgi:hypothetical protein